METLLITLALFFSIENTALPGLPHDRILMEFKPMAGTCLSDPELAATPGFYLTRIGVSGTADNF